MLVARVLRTRIRVNPFFLILMSALAITGRIWEGLILFGVAGLHEMAHLLVARRYGFTVEEVELLPFGGVARLAGTVDISPAAETGIAVAGPLSNGLMCLIVLLVEWYAVNHNLDFGDVGGWIEEFFCDNMLIGVFNLLPALPLDGGRIARSLLARRIGYHSASCLAFSVAKSVGVIMCSGGAVGLYLGLTNVSLIVLGCFLCLSAFREEKSAGYVFIRYLTRKNRELQAEGVLRVQHFVVSEKTPIKVVLHRFVPGRYNLVTVMDSTGRIRGQVSEREAIEGMFTRGPDTLMQELLQEAQ